jgi:hypothetical protein
MIEPMASEAIEYIAVGRMDRFDPTDLAPKIKNIGCHDVRPLQFFTQRRKFGTLVKPV